MYDEPPCLRQFLRVICLVQYLLSCTTELIQFRFLNTQDMILPSRKQSKFLTLSVTV